MDSGGAWPSFSSLTSAARTASKYSQYVPPFFTGTKPPPQQPAAPELPGFNISSSLDYLNKLSSPSKPSYRSTSKSTSNNLFSGSIFQYVTLGVLTAFIAVLFTYIFNKDKAFGFDAYDKGIIVACLVLVGVGGSYFFNSNIIDFLISSQINIICVYLLISYVGLSSFSGENSWVSLINFGRTVASIVVDPTNIFKKGYSLIIPLVLLIIPLLVLLYNFTKNIFVALLVLGVSVGVVYTLYPKNNVTPIEGGTRLIGGTGPTCVEHWYQNLNPLYWGLPSCK